VRNIFSRHSFQFGPLISLTYNRVSQNAFEIENGSVTPMVKSDLIKGVIGLNVEIECVPCFCADEQLFRVYARAGLGCQSKRLGLGRHVIESIAPRYENRNFVNVTCGFRQKLNGNWDISGALDSELHGNYSYNRASITCSYAF
jgi:hypothetical protein